MCEGSQTTTDLKSYYEGIRECMCKVEFYVVKRLMAIPPPYPNDRPKFRIGSMTVACKGTYNVLIEDLEERLSYLLNDYPNPTSPI